MNPFPKDEMAHLRQSSAAQLGFWMALLLTMATVAAFAIGIATPPRSGPFCMGSCIVYPFTKGAQFVPRDYLWGFPGIMLVPLFLVVAGCASEYVETQKKHLSLICLCFASISTAIVSVDYFIQYAVVEPSLIRQETSGLGLLSLYNPHGIYIALEDLGFLILSLAFLFAGFAIPQARAAAKAIRWTLIVSAGLAFVTFGGMSWRFGFNIETRFELAIISIVWTTLIVAGVLFSVFFWKIGRQGQTSSLGPK